MKKWQVYPDHHWVYLELARAQVSEACRLGSNLPSFLHEKRYTDATTMMIGSSFLLYTYWI
jgi:hypothetical protein